MICCIILGGMCICCSLPFWAMGIAKDSLSLGLTGVGLSIFGGMLLCIGCCRERDHSSGSLLTSSSYHGQFRSRPTNTWPAATDSGQENIGPAYQACQPVALHRNMPRQATQLENDPLEHRSTRPHTGTSSYEPCRPVVLPHANDDERTTQHDDGSLTDQENAGGDTRTSFYQLCHPARSPPTDSNQDQPPQLENETTNIMNVEREMRTSSNQPGGGIASTSSYRPCQPIVYADTNVDQDRALQRENEHLNIGMRSFYLPEHTGRHPTHASDAGAVGMSLWVHLAPEYFDRFTPRPPVVPSTYDYGASPPLYEEVQDGSQTEVATYSPNPLATHNFAEDGLPSYENITVGHPDTDVPPAYSRDPLSSGQCTPLPDYGEIDEVV